MIGAANATTDKSPLFSGERYWQTMAVTEKNNSATIDTAITASSRSSKRSLPLIRLPLRLRFLRRISFE